MIDSIDNLRFFKNNIDFYSEEYKDYSLRPWENRIVGLVSGPLVLDVACGGGRMTVPLLRRGHNVVGVDFVGQFEERIRRHESEFVGAFRFVESDMISLPFEADTFDSITCINSLVYLRNIEEVRKALREMCRVLKPFRWLYITTWNIRHPYWATSAVLNYLMRRGKRFGETSPFWATDRRTKSGRTHMFVPSKRVLERECRMVGISNHICTGWEFVGRRSPLASFHPIIVVAGMKGV
jgi:ubiquinone/menaquinone biosynthesis C-methylase UbiE